MDNEKADSSTESKRRRSSRLSGGLTYGKRKRESEEGEALGAKMTKTGNVPEAEASKVNFTFDDIKKFMNGEFLDKVNVNVDKSIKKLSDRIDETQNELKTHKEQIGKELAKMRKYLELDRGPPTPIVGSYAEVASHCPEETNRSDDRRGNQYWRARRSSRIFPIQGETEEEMRASLRDFFITKLKMPARDIHEDDIEMVRRVRLRRDRESQGEVTVLF